MPKTIQDLKADLAAYRAGRSATSTPAAPAAPAPVETPKSPIAQDLESYRAMRASGSAPNPDVPKDPNMLAEFARGIFSAPATIVARPVQAVAELAGADAEDVDAFSSKISGGLIAPTPKNFGDVKKDVGRAAQTVAFGTGAPIAGGALFGAGASLEQGNDLLSLDTAFSTALGGAGGKVLDLVGKPLLNAAGKVVGTISPQILKDVAAGGAKAIQKFMAENKLLGGVAAPLAEGVERTFQGVDNAINTGTKKAFDTTKKVAAEQFPGLDPTAHYKAVNERDFIKPTTENRPAYNKATAIYKDAKSRGIDLEKVATENGIQHDKLIDGKNYNTKDTAEAIRQANYDTSDELMRPIIREVQSGVRSVPVSEVRGAMLKRIHDIPANELKAKDREAMIRSIEKEYGAGGAEARAHPNGYNLEALHDSRIVSGKNGGYKIGQSASDALNAQRSREEAKVFKDLFDRNVPKEAGLTELRKEFEKNFLLADYLESLHTKAIPEGVTKKAIRLFGRAVGGTVGGKLGGFSGFLFGSQGGDMLFRGFQALPNPLKEAVLNRAFANRAQSPVFETLRKYLGDQVTERLLRKALPAPGQSSFKKTEPTIFTTPKGVSTKDRGEAFDITAVEEGRARTGSGLKGRRLKDMMEAAGEATGPYVPPNELPVTKMGRVPRKPRNLNDIQF